MKEQNNNNHFLGVAGKSDERGISVVELIIVVAMIGVVTAFAVMQIGGSQRAMRVTNSARELAGWLEKARIDSVRRHAMTGGEMANVRIATSSSYVVTIDQNGDGILDPPRTITIPAVNNASFAGITIPTTIYYNWRGRTVDSSGNLVNHSFSLRDGSGNINPINLTSTGDTSLGSNVNTTAVSVSGGSTTANIRAKTYGP
jgi:Tfp pilus assembly protein FimT